MMTSLARDGRGGVVLPLARWYARLVLVAGLVAAAVAGMLGVATADAGSTPLGGGVGFSPGAGITWESDAELNRDLDLMQGTGATWIRLDLDWSAVESTRGRYDWSATDRVVKGARARGLQVLALPAYTPAWARPAGTDSHTAPADPAPYAAFVQAAVRRYAEQGVRHWEIWNEPNLAQFWAPRPDPAAYAALLSAAASAVRAVDPTATVLAGGLSPAVDAQDGSEVAPPTFLERVYAAGAGSAFDAVAVHPYSFPALPMDPATGEWNTFRRLPLVRQIMVDRGDAAKKVWLTEFGAPTGTADAAVTPDLQAEIVRNALTQVRKWSWAGPLFYYAARDTGTDAADREQNFGLVRRDFSRKPAYDAFVGAVREQAAGLGGGVTGGLGSGAAGSAPGGSGGAGGDITGSGTVGRPGTVTPYAVGAQSQRPVIARRTSLRGR